MFELNAERAAEERKLAEEAEQPQPAAEAKPKPRKDHKTIDMFE